MNKSYFISDVDECYTQNIKRVSEAIEKIRPSFFVAQGWCREEDDLLASKLIDVMALWYKGSVYYLCIVSLSFRDDRVGMYFLPLKMTILSKTPTLRIEKFLQKNEEQYAFTFVTTSDHYGRREWIGYHAILDEEFFSVFSKIFCDNERIYEEKWGHLEIHNTKDQAFVVKEILSDVSEQSSGYEAVEKMDDLLFISIKDDRSLYIFQKIFPFDSSLDISLNMLAKAYQVESSHQIVSSFYYLAADGQTYPNWYYG